MPKRVLDIGNCGPDHAALTELIRSNFDAAVDRADRLTDAVSLLERGGYSLALVNRLLDGDGSPGIDVIRSLREKYPELPMMMLTNFDDHQQTAVAAGAVAGFGKRDLQSESTLSLLANYLA